MKTFLEDEHVLPAEEQPLPPVDSPTTESPGYVAESDPEEDPEYEDDEEQDGPVDYHMGEEEDEEDEDEEEYIASVDSTAVIPVVELVSSPEGTKPVLPPPSIDITTTGARISANGSVCTSITTTLPSSGCLTQTQTLRITSTQALTDAVTAALPSSSVDRRDEIPESERPPRKRSCLFTIGSRYEAGESSTTRPTGGQGTDYEFVNLLMGDRMTLQETVWTVEEEAYVARVARNNSIGLSQATYQELQTHRDHVYAHETHIQTHQTQLQLQSTLIQTQHQVQLTETLRVVKDMRREMSDMQKELISQQEQLRRERQPGSDARFPDHQKVTGDMESHP
nr:hypothetical protein [Tanacetum cinerariifolium]